jgi:hypothetical protein
VEEARAAAVLVEVPPRAEAMAEAQPEGRAATDVADFQGPMLQWLQLRRL